MSEKSRYRLEGDRRCVDIKIASIEQVFDTRDPAPFRERDLDPDLVEYLLDAGEDLVGEPSYRVVFWLEQPAPAAEIELAFRRHFEDVIERIGRTRRRGRRTGQVTLLLGVLLVIVLLMLARLVTSIVPGSLGAGLKEGLVISSWVVLWRPVEVLIYDWIPVRHERKVAVKLLEASIELRAGKPPDVRISDRG